MQVNNKSTTNLLTVTSSCCSIFINALLSPCNTPKISLAIDSFPENDSLRLVSLVYHSDTVIHSIPFPIHCLSLNAFGFTITFAQRFRRIHLTTAGDASRIACSMTGIGERTCGKLEEKKHSQSRSHFGSPRVFRTKRFIVWLVYTFQFFANIFAHDISGDTLKHWMVTLASDGA